MVAAMPIFQILSIPATVVGKKATLLDRSGEVLLHGIPLPRVDGPIPSDLSERRLWHLAISHMLSRTAGDRWRAVQNPWVKKADCLAHSLRLRRLDCPVKSKEWQRFEKYATTQWDQAIERLYQQSYNRVRRYRQSGWNLWAYTVSKNHNKRNGGRYARTQCRHISNDSQSA